MLVKKTVVSEFQSDIIMVEVLIKGIISIRLKQQQKKMLLYYSPNNLKSIFVWNCCEELFLVFYLMISTELCSLILVYFFLNDLKFSKYYRKEIYETFYWFHSMSNCNTYEK